MHPGIRVRRSATTDRVSRSTALLLSDHAEPGRRRFEDANCAVLDFDPTGVHANLRRLSWVDSAQLDFHLRRSYDVTYDEYLAGMTYEEMTGTANAPPRDDERRYQF